MITQSLIPEKSLFFTGETATFSFYGIPADKKGRAVLRTNIGGGAAKIAEQIEKTEANRTPKGSDWHDLEMHRQSDGSFKLTLPLTEVGVFEAKCCFLPADKSPAIWSSGNNFHLKVTSNANVSGNGIYCCFVRQWGKWMYLPHSPEQPDFETLDQEGFTIVPPSGTFRNVIRKLDHIFDTLNCRILQLLPIHPTPMAYGRMGRYGSPFAATDYFAVDPALAEFDTSATPMEQFTELIDAVHARGGRIFMDLPVNHTGWASKLQSEHPDYFIRNENKHFVSPGAWGIVWADLCQLDYRQSKVHDLMAKVFLFWCKRGVDGFRCDAGYMVPQDAWEYIIAKVRNEFPDTTFLLEGLGGPVPVQEKLLEQCGLDWGYSELFQNYTRDAINGYYPYMTASARRGGTLVNFSETHDNLRLAANGKAYAKLRLMVNALLAVNGTFGFANGAEFYATEKIDVHQCGALNFGAVDNLCALTGKINILLATHPAFGTDAEISLIQQGPGNVIAALRKSPGHTPLLILLNLDCENASFIHFSQVEFDGGRDLLSGKFCNFTGDNGVKKIQLAPAEALCIAFDDFSIPETMPKVPELKNALKAARMAQSAALNYTTLANAARADGKSLCADPEKFVESVSGISPAPVCRWHYPQDACRIVMAAPQDILLIHSPVPFIAELTNSNTTLCRVESLLQNSGEHFALLKINSRRKRTSPENITLNMTAFEPDGVRKISGNILLLADPEKRLVHLSGRWQDAGNHYVFGSNVSSSYAMFSAQWGKLNSKYDAILAVNDNPEYPVDRHIMFTRCRAWLVVDEYSQELTVKSLENYSAHPGNRAKWEFLVPDGHGGRCTLSVRFRMAFDRNAIELEFQRKMRTDGISPEAKLILRPDLEDRVNHTTTRACDGAEKHFPASVTAKENGFDFQPAGRKLQMRISAGKFHISPEWNYMVDLPQERYYGMNDKTDLFSPGYFEIPLALGGSVTLSAGVGKDLTATADFPDYDFPAALPPEALAIDSLNRFIVKRDGLNTVIAGYPWFLDWGRDTLIVLRGLVKFPEFQEKAAQIIRRFAAFEKSGTIPNMICGGNDSNRDTTDAPLYLIIAVRDYIAETGNKKFLTEKCNGRTIKEILLSIIHHYRTGTPNRIIMDQESGLIFSPSHFTWMDTNYPAGTPREGYPIEIQSLWYAALEFLGERQLAAKVRQSIEKYFFTGTVPADCLHCASGTPASQAIADDHLRCNILTAITLGAVSDPEKQRRILNHTSKLLIPGAIRTLDDSEVSYPLPVSRDGRLLNTPNYPYQGYYRGPEDTSRKVAYHNGTAWGWPFPAYCEALAAVGDSHSNKRALALLMSAIQWMENGVIGEMPEVLDGHAPHLNGGCLAQAWSVSEFYRVFKILSQAGI